MPENALFDIASMTKFYTQIIAFNLMKEGVFSPKSKIAELDNRFKNLGDLTVYDVTSFMTEFRTPGRIDDQKTVEEAKDTLYGATVHNKGAYNYNDIGMMIMKEVMENQTDLSYNELVQKYIVQPLGLTDTHLIVPNNKFHLLTGSPVTNARQGLVNDPKAIALGGYSGHAGMWSSSDDLIKLMKGVHKNGIVPNISAAYTSGINQARGIMRNTYTTHPKGLDVSYLDITEPFDSFVIQGSTRVNATGSRNSAHNILFNPSSMSIEEAKEQEFRFNQNQIEQNKNPQRFVKQFEFSRNNELLNVDLIDPRQLLPGGQSIEKVIAENAKITVMLNFLNKVLKDYYHYYEDININYQGKSR